ncbi:hypothetical protein KQI61_07825 [Anaerocolumna aminovalerica]|uniref:hypothetical protein n=1 Tax=Anaerocolumna aminovalerica TaxID=1527 RepID=UPI001C0EE476|nr:hypothetical protein [Anaerocolumna aminovalerica]MBU5332105.1 hypothetical protein [Anaerocolumna aminovalerica]
MANKNFTSPSLSENKKDNIIHAVMTVDKDADSIKKDEYKDDVKKIEKPKIKEIKCKVLLTRYNGIVVALNGNGVFIHTKTKYKVGDNIDVKIDGKSIML